jgi:hypothetical protein
MGSIISQQSKQIIPIETLGMAFLEKHKKYKDSYGTNEIFYGIGIENELYLEFDKSIYLNKYKFLNKTNRERYSVDYNSSYHKEKLELALKTLADSHFSSNEFIKIPLLLNSHSFEYCDINAEQKTLYVKEIKANPLFSGKTLAEVLFENNDYLRSNYEKTFVFDGDTIEFITTNFYQTKISQVIEELSNIKKCFIENLNNTMKEQNIFQKYGNITIMKKNYPFSTHLTNSNNYGMFNNGTVHINITLPTYLDGTGNIKDKKLFIYSHKNFIKYIQFLEPLLIAKYGSPDVYSQQPTEFKNIFSAGSQRCAVSRYIGIGTFDIDKMITGKILTNKIENMEFSKNDYWWYNKFHENSAYKKLDQIGLDINFNKHYNHGVELRIFDHIEENQIKDVLEFLVYIADFILDKKNKRIVDSIPNPSYDKQWNELTEKVIRFGSNAKINNDDVKLFSNMFSNEFSQTYSNPIDLYTDINYLLTNKYQKDGKFSSKVSTKQIVEIRN